MKQTYIKKLLDHYNIGSEIRINLSSSCISLLCDIMSIFESRLLIAMKKTDKLQKLKTELEPLVQVIEFKSFFDDIEADKNILDSEERQLSTKTKTCKKISDSIRYKFSFKDFKKHCSNQNIMLFPIPSELKSISDNGNQFSEKKVVRNGRAYLIPILCTNNMIVDNENHSQYVYSTIMLQVFMTILSKFNLRNEIITKYEFINSIYENKDFYKSLGMKVTDVDMTKIKEPTTPQQINKLFSLLTSLNVEINENISTLPRLDLINTSLHVLSFELGNDKAVKTINDLFKEETIKESSKVSSKSKKSVSSSSKVKSSVVRKSMSARTSMRSYTKSPTSSRCKKYGIRSDGLCKKKPGRKSLSVKSLRKSSAKRSSAKSSPSRCKYGVRSDGLCKKKPGPRKSRRA